MNEVRTEIMLLRFTPAEQALMVRLAEAKEITAEDWVYRQLWGARQRQSRALSLAERRRGLAISADEMLPFVPSGEAQRESSGVIFRKICTQRGRISEAAFYRAIDELRGRGLVAHHVDGGYYRPAVEEELVDA